ncbi:MAG: peptidylprolyl isomerase [Bacteroidota bacterium]
MALIGKIRKNSWILVVLVGLGLAGFIVMDMTSGQQSVFGSGQTTLASVEGEKLEWNRFYNTEQVLYRGATGDVYQRRDALYNYFVEEAIVKQEAEKAGLGVSRTELMDLQFGPQPSSIIVQRFGNPQAPGQVNREQLNTIKQIIEENRIQDAIAQGQLSRDFNFYWAHQEKEIIKDRLQNKMNAMVSKAMYMPNWMVEMEYKAQNQQVDFAYVKVPYDELDNTEVTLTESDYQSFVSGREATYRQEEETRRLDYVVFDVFPTGADSAKWRKQIADLTNEFEITRDDSLFVENNFGTIDAAYVKKAALGGAVSDTLFSMPIGKVYGPYFEAGAYKAVKLLDRKVIPDSVEVRHILRSARSPIELVSAQNTIDSLRNLIETGAGRFDSLAVAFSQDPGSGAKGGDLGWSYPNQMVKPFNDVIFFEAEIGKLYTVASQFGVHLIEVTDKKFINNEEAVKVAYLQQKIVPSEETQSQLYDRALEFVGQNRTMDALRSSISNDPALSIETTSAMKKNDYNVATLGGGQSSRDMVRWAFGASAGEVSPEVYSYQDAVDYFTNKYVVVGLNDIQRAGLPPVAAVKEDIEQQVINLKKGEQLEAAMKGKSLAELSTQYAVKVDTASNVSFNAAFVPNIGAEPKVMGALFKMDQDEVSQPIVGTSGVYVVKMIKKPITAAPTNIPVLRPQLSATTKSQASGNRIIQAIKKNADISDNRFRFY